MYLLSQLMNVELYYSVLLPMMKTVHVFISMHLAALICLDSGYRLFNSDFYCGKVILWRCQTAFLDSSA